MAQAFYLKRFEQALATMMGWFYGNQSKVTDQTVGAVARTLLEASAIEIEELYQQMANAIEAAQAEGTYAAFSFSRLPAKKATGTVTFTGTPASTVGVGTSVATEATATVPAVQFVVTAEVTIPGGGSVDAPVEAILEGTEGNVDAGTITRLLSIVPGVSSIANAAKLTNGRDIESATERADRFARYIASLSQATEDAIRQAAMDVDGVFGVSPVESPELTVLSYDQSGDAFTDDSNVAAVPDVTTFKLVSAAPAAGDIAYFGAGQKFDMLRFRFLVPADGDYAGVWEYYNGDEYATLLSIAQPFDFSAAPLTLVLNTDGLGDETATFVAPGSWTAAQVADVINQDCKHVVATVEGTQVRIRSKTSGVSSSIVVQASSTAEIILGFTGANANASSWPLLAPTDQTEGFTASGIVSYSSPSDWIPNSVYDMGKFWVRYRVVSGTPTAADCNLIDASPFPEDGVLIVAHDSDGALSAALKAAVEEAVGPVRAKGIPYSVIAPVLVPIDVAYAVTPVTGVGLTIILAKTDAAVQALFGNLRAGETLRVERITQAILNAASASISDLSLTEPTDDRAAAPTELIQLGTLTGM